MAGFLSRLELSPCGDGRRWMLLAPFEYHLGRADSGIVIHVATGFVTDLASIPRFFWRVLPPWDRYSNAAVLHDWLYQTALLSRAMSDAVFLEAMTVLGVPRWKRWLIYSAVRLFGWRFYKRQVHARGKE